MRAVSAANISAQELWHKRLGHLNRKGMRKLKNIVTGIDFRDEVDKVCVTCLEGKQTVKPFPKRGSRAKVILDLIHSDIHGPMEVPSWGGARYCLIFIDDFSRKVFGYMIQQKSETLSKFRLFKAMVEKHKQVNQLNA